MDDPKLMYQDLGLGGVYAGIKGIRSMLVSISTLVRGLQRTDSANSSIVRVRQKESRLG